MENNIFSFVLFISGLINLYPVPSAQVNKDIGQKNKKKIIKWQNKQINKVFEIMHQQNKYCVGLGFGASDSFNEAKLIAQQSATADLAETTTLYVATVVKLGNQFVNGKNHTVFTNQIYTKSELNVKEIKYKMLDETKFDDKYYVAFIAYSNKSKLRLIFPFSGFQQQQRFYETVDSVLMSEFKEKYKTKAK